MDSEKDRSKPPLLPDLPASAFMSYRPEVLSLGTGGVLPEEVPTLVDLPTGMEWPPAEKPEEERRPEPQEADLELDSPLGSGGFGSVWQGRQTGLERRVAVKCLRWDLLAESSLGQRRRLEALFQQEALTAASLEHPNIVPVYQVGRSVDGRLLLTMKQVRGTAWNDLILEDLDLPAETFLARHIPILIAVSQAVAYAHSEGVLHRDIKPHQVLVGDFGEVMLTDWGLALRFREPRSRGATSEAAASEARYRGVPDGTSRDDTPGDDPARNISTAASPAGTPAFMAPEQTRAGTRQLGPWTDLYLLGGTLYYLLTGKPPHGAGSGGEAFASAASGQVLPAFETTARQGIPRELEDLALGVLAPNVEDRQPSTVAAFTESLREYLSGISRQRRSTEIVQRLKDAETPTEAAGYETAKPKMAGYGQLDSWVGDLQEAENLWPGNPGLAPQKERFFGLYSSVALDRRDLTLARLQAERLPPGATREGLLARVRQAEEARQATKAQRRWALRGLLALGLLLTLGAGKYLVDQRRAQERLVQQRDAAEAARAETEGLMSFMLEDVGDRLIEIQHAEILSPVAERARQFYSSRGKENLDLEARLSRGKMLQTLGSLLAIQGEQKKGEAVLGDAAAIYQEAYEETADPDHLLTLLELRMLLGQMLSDQGKREQALAGLTQVEMEIRQAIERWPEQHDFRLQLAQAVDFSGVVYYDDGDLDQAGEAFLEAGTVLDTWQEMTGGSAAGEALRHGIDFHQIVVLNETGRSEEALESYGRAFPRVNQMHLLEAMIGESPVAVFTLCLRGEILNNLQRYEETIRFMNRILVLTAADLAQDTENHEAIYRHSLALEVSAAALEAVGKEKEARESRIELVEMLLPIGESTDLLYLRDALVRSLLKLGREKEAKPFVEMLREVQWRHRAFEAFVQPYGF